MERFRAVAVLAMFVLSSLPVSGIDSPSSESTYVSEIPEVKINNWSDLPWWETTSRDLNRNGIVDWLEEVEDEYKIGVMYEHQPTESDYQLLSDIGVEVRYHVSLVNGLLLGMVDSDLFETISNFPGVLMVEPYGKVVFYGDVQTPAIKASNSSVYPVGAWDLGYTGKGVNVAIVDTGIDDEHPGLAGKAVAGYDAVCTDDPLCVVSLQQDDGSFDPDDQNQHGTACAGMATSNGILPGGESSNFTGAAPDANLVDVRIGTAFGAGPFENYVIEQEFYESAMDGLNWVIENKDTAWNGADNESFGIDIISLSWGITSTEDGGSDGSDMFSQVLDEATLAGVVVSVAAGNSGPGNDGLSGMGASSLSITVGALDDEDTIDREDDIIASYSSRGPRRDNNDGNPYDEMKPDVSAPGTNIIQAEACYWSNGGCYNRNPLDDASNNGYSGRGSGTSYATPAVSGVLALMIEANPDLDPLALREILRLTSERREILSSDPQDPNYAGEGVEDGPWATAPELDPYWNRHFGWGMVDAHAAVKSASLNTETESLNVNLQAHLTEVDGTTFSGIAWSRDGNISRVEYSLDGGSWSQVQYGQSNATSIYLDWTFSLDSKELSFTGNHTVLVRAVGDDSSYSISDDSEFYAIGESSETSIHRMAAMLFAIAAIVVTVMAVTAYRKKLLGNG